MIILRSKLFFSKGKDIKYEKKRKKAPIGEQFTPHHLNDMQNEAIDRIINGEDKEAVIDEYLERYKYCHKKYNWKRDNSGLLVKGIIESLKNKYGEKNKY